LQPEARNSLPAHVIKKPAGNPAGFFYAKISMANRMSIVIFGPSHSSATIAPKSIACLLQLLANNSSAGIIDPFANYPDISGFPLKLRLNKSWGF